MLFKKTTDQDPRTSSEALAGGRRIGESENPYLSARRTWNDHARGVAASRQMWQIFGILSLLIALGGIGGMIHVGSQSRFIPYVVEVDKLGQAALVNRADKAGPVDQRVIKASVAAFIANARTVTPDAALQRKAIFGAYAMLSPTDPATQKMNDWLNATDESSPFVKATKTMVNIDNVTVLQHTPETWQVDWIETTRDRQGVIKDQPVFMRALITVYIVEQTPATTEEQMQNNPLGIYVRDFSWTRLQN
jgi:type IV secretion system protein VirB5